MWEDKLKWRQLDKSIAINQHWEERTRENLMHNQRYHQLMPQIQYYQYYIINTIKITFTLLVLKNRNKRFINTVPDKDKNDNGIYGNGNF